MVPLACRASWAGRLFWLDPPRLFSWKGFGGAWAGAFPGPGPALAGPPDRSLGGMSKSKVQVVRVPSSNQSIMAGKKNVAHPKRVEKRRSKYRQAFRRGELE